jgi:tRNA-splicing ligase RtcB
MFTLNGRYASAKIFTDNVESTAQAQIINLLNQPFAEGSNIRIMPDVHAGAGCVIGFTALMGDKVIPNLIGVDIGCGMLCVEIGGLSLNLDRLDRIIHDNIPAGYNINDRELSNFRSFANLVCLDGLKNKENFGKAIGSLGGGNHFIEVNVSEFGVQYLVIHSGSRNLGKQVAEYYQKLAVDECKGRSAFLQNREFTINSLKMQGRQKDIGKMLRKMDAEFSTRHPEYPADLCFLTGNSMKDYLHDMRICQSYASWNRTTIAQTILKCLDSDLHDYKLFETVHNYINFKDDIMRKGAVSAKKDEQLIIPINMRDGSLLCVGKGNEDWNYSAPHGAGRLMSRSEAKRTFDMSDYEMSMDGIYTTCVNPSTLDESPMAYKPIEEILQNIEPTVSVVDVINPIYNFKAGGE